MANQPNGQTTGGTISVDDLFATAESLEAQYRAILAAKEANRTMLRSLAAQGFVDKARVDEFYPPKKGGGRKKAAA